MSVRRSFRQGLAPVTALLLLSLLESFGALRGDLAPGWSTQPLSPMLRQAIPLAIFALLSLCVAARRPSLRLSRSLWVTAALAGTGLFVVPALFVNLASESLPSWTGAAIFTFTPVFAVVFDPYLGGDREGRDQEASVDGRALAGALAGTAGALCLLPVAIPTSLTTAARLCGLVLAALSAGAANCLATRASRASLPAFAAVATGAASLLLGSLGAIRQLVWKSPDLRFSFSRRDLFWFAGVQLPALALLLWLLPRMRAPQMATRYLWSLIFPVIFAAAFLQASVGWRSWLGVALLGIGAVSLLLGAEPAAPPPGLSLLRPDSGSG